MQQPLDNALCIRAGSNQWSDRHVCHNGCVRLVLCGRLFMEHSARIAALSLMSPDALNEHAYHTNGLTFANRYAAGDRGPIAVLLVLIPLV